MKIIGIIPARMAASRFPGKPMHKLLGRPMLEHVYIRANMFQGWSSLAIATCDLEIADYAMQKNYPVIMTGAHHSRALDRVAEAITLMPEKVEDDDIVVCVQGDEPMMRPDMIEVVIEPLIKDPKKAGTILSMHINEESVWKNPDTVKIIHNDFGEVLYTSRVPLPYSKAGFSEDLMARRIYGIFAFRCSRLMEFTNHPETRLEMLESCDSNRILDMPFRQYVAQYPATKSYSVDSPMDAVLVEREMKNDDVWKKYQ